MLCNISEGRKSRLHHGLSLKLRKNGHVTSSILSSTLLSNNVKV